MSNPLYTTTQIEEFADGDQQFLKDTISIFLKEAPDNIIKLEEALNQGSWTKLHDVAHRFAPHLAFFEINEAHIAVRRIITLAKEETGWDEVRENINILKDKGLTAINQMKEDFGI